MLDYNYFIGTLKSLSKFDILKIADENYLDCDKIDEQFRHCSTSNEMTSEVYELWVIFILIEFHDNEYAVEVCRLWAEKFSEPLPYIYEAYINDDYLGGVKVGHMNALTVQKPDSIRIHSLIDLYTGLYYKEFDKNKAIHLLEKSFGMYPQNVHAIVELGDIYKSQGILEMAKQLYRKAIEAVRIIDVNRSRSPNWFLPKSYVDEMLLWSTSTDAKIDFWKSQS